MGDRLRTATLDYEETGWYDGATFHKPQEVLVRDRLLAAYEVRPRVCAHLSESGAQFLDRGEHLAAKLKLNGHAQYQPCKIARLGSVCSSRAQTFARAVRRTELLAG